MAVLFLDCLKIHDIMKIYFILGGPAMIRKIFPILFIISLCVLLSACSQNDPVIEGSKYTGLYEAGETDYSDGWALMENIRAGWNLGNTLDAPREGDWSPVATRDNIKSVKEMGFNAVRVPVTWTEHIGSAPEYKIDKEFMDRVEQVVDWVLDEEMYCILNLHHDEVWIAKMSENHDEVYEKFCRVWEQIADRFKNKSLYLILEADNEQGFEGHDPDEESFKLMNELNLGFVDIVRASGGKNSERFLALPSVYTNTAYVEELALPEGDGHILAAFHYYSPWDFTVNAWGAATWGSDEQKQALNADLKQAYDAFDGKVPMYVGEYGAWNAYLPYRTYYTEYLLKSARKLGMACFMWDIGEVMDRTTNEWNDPIVSKEAVSAGSGVANSFVKPLELYLKKGNAEDKALEIEYNGNTLVEIRDGEKVLGSGDYEMTEGGVILKKEYLEKLMSGDFGIKTTLVFEFSGGVDYELRVRYYDTPIQGGEITNISLVGNDGKIPVNWNGDRVATVRGVRSNGASANSRDPWTKYFKMFDDFRTDESGVYMTAEFRHMIDEDVTITFEMFSGETFDVEIKHKD